MTLFYLGLQSFKIFQVQGSFLSQKSFAPGQPNFSKKYTKPGTNSKPVPAQAYSIFFNFVYDFTRSFNLKKILKESFI